MGSRQSKSPQIPPKPNAYLRFDDFEVFRAIGRGAFGKVSISLFVHRPGRGPSIVRKMVSKTIALYSSYIIIMGTSLCEDLM